MLISSDRQIIHSSNISPIPRSRKIFWFQIGVRLCSLDVITNSTFLSHVARVLLVEGELLLFLSVNKKRSLDKNNQQDKPEIFHFFKTDDLNNVRTGEDIQFVECWKRVLCRQVLIRSNLYYDNDENQ